MGSHLRGPYPEPDESNEPNFILDAFALFRSALTTAPSIRLSAYRTDCFSWHLILSRFRGDYRRGMDLWIDLMTTYTHHSELQVLNNPIADFHTSHIITAPVKPFPACCVLTSRSLAAASNSGDSSTSRPQVLLSQPPVQNSLSTQP
jgi:hypothetical protein